MKEARSHQLKIRASFHQERLWFIDSFETGNIYESNPVYHNVPLIIEIKGTPGIPLLEQSIRTLINRHEVLRTRLTVVGDQLYQQVEPDLDLKLSIVDLCPDHGKEKTGKDPLNTAIHESRQPFILTGDPLTRALLIKCSPTRSLLVITLHHIIADRYSLKMIYHELVFIYQALSEGTTCQLEEVPLHYADFSNWQREISPDALESMRFYWNRQLSGLKPLDLPADKQRAHIHIYRQGRIRFQLSSECSTRIKKFCQQNNTGNDVLLLAGLNVLLNRYCGQEDITVGTSIDNRHQPGTLGIIGPVANLLVIRTGIPKTSPFLEYFSHLWQTLEQAYEYQDIPFDWLAEQLNPKRDMSRTVFFDVLFQYDREPPGEISLGSLNFKYIETNLGWGKYDLNLLIRDNGKIFSGILVYNAEYYNESTASRFANHYKVLLDSILENPHQKISCLALLTPGEKQLLLNQWNKTRVNYPKDRTIIEIFKTRAESAPDHTALIGQFPNPQSQIPNKTEPCSDNTSLTYKELNEKSNQLTHMLIEKGVKTETIIGIMVERSVEMIIGIIAILKAGGAYLPIDPDYPEERIDYMLKDSAAKILLTSQEIAGLFSPKALNNNPKGTSLSGIWNSEFGIFPHQGGQLAYIIYTSGSTGRPKGVMIDHRSLVGLFFNDQFPFDFNGSDIWTMFHSPCFDFSVWEIWGALLYGGKLILVPKISARDTFQFAALLRARSVTILNQTPSAFYNLITQELTVKDTGISLRYVIFGGEALNPGKLDKWKEKYPQVRLINMYGITETTVHVTYKEITVKEIRENLGYIGKPLATLTAYVLDEQQQLQPLGVYGELYIAGIGLGRGYLNRPALTADWFVDNPHKPGERLYRSGDLVRMLETHEMIYAGRADLQVQLRGFRIEPGEIENQLLACPGVKEAVVLDRQDETGDLYLCAYIVGDNAPGPAETRQMLGRTLPDYMIPAYVVKIEAIPLTPNGKVDRQALPAPAARSTVADYVAPQDPVQQKLADIWAEVLNIKSQDIGINTSFFEIGGHSLKATIMTARVHQQFHVKIPLAQVFITPTIKALSGFIRSTGKKSYISIEPAEEKEYYPLAPAQKRLYVLHQLASTSTYYNMPQVIEPGETPDKEKLERAFKKMIARHDSLRTSFETVKEEPVQRIHPQADFSLEYKEIALEEIGNIIENFAQPFDLSRPPLLRVNILTVGAARQLLFIDMHHIISDGTSQEISRREFTAFYSGQVEELPPIKLQYKDYSQWLNSQEQVELRKKQEVYWLKEYGEDELPVLNLPTDFPRPQLQSFEGNWVSFALDKQETGILNDLAREHDVTIYMILLALFNVLFAKLSSQEDIVIGTPIAARRQSDLQQVIGMLVNTLPMRNYPARSKPFNHFLKEVKQRTIDSYENQEYPFEELVEHIDVQRDTSRNPLFDILLNLVNLAENPGEPPRTHAGEKPPYRHEKMTSRFDMCISAFEVEKGQDIYFNLEYSTRLFKPVTIERWIGYLKQIILSLPGNTGQTIQEIDYIPLAEKQTILEYCTGVKENPGPGLTIHRVFQEKVNKSIDHTALVYENRCLTYGALNCRANQLARLLKEKGIGPDKPVGVMMERSLELIIALLAVEKAGGAYVPIDPEHPEKRVLFILEDSKVSLLLTCGHLVGQPCFKALKDTGTAASPGNPLVPAREEISRALPLERTATQKNFTTLLTDDLWPTPLEKYPGQDLELIHQQGNLFYVIYTSGSTGSPKGVMLEHRNLLNLIHYQYNRTNIDFNRVLQFTTIGFDVSAQEIFSTLLAGGRLVLVDKEALTDLPLLFGIVKKEYLNTLFLPTSFLKFMINEEDYVNLLPNSISHIVTAGEQLIINERFKNYLRDNKVHLHNHYGPSETHVVTALTLYPQEEIPGIPSIGKSIANTMIYILDRGLRLVPLGVPGELFIAGMQVGRGYLNNPVLTSERFVNYKLPIRNKVVPFNRDLKNLAAEDTEITEKVYSKDQCSMTNDPPHIHHSTTPLLHHSPLTIQHSPIYQTGDLARWLEDGNLEFLGRKDFQVKIRGFRVELGEIEARLLAHKQIRECAVMAREDENRGNYLCAYVVSRGELETSSLREFLARGLPGYMQPAYFVFLDRLPLTPNRKLDRKALPLPGLKAAVGHQPPRTLVEKKLARIWSEVLKTSQQFIGIESNFFHLGGNSLNATILTSNIHKEFQVKLPLVEIFNAPTLKGLARYLQGAVRERCAAIEPIEQKEYYILSSAQKRLYILQQMNWHNTAYNLPGNMLFNEAPHLEKLNGIFCQLITRHESLRTSFHIIDNEPVQRIHQAVPFGQILDTCSEISPGETTGHHSSSIIHHFVKPFDLSHAPLLRVGLMKLPGEKSIILVDMHHIISDGISHELLIKEFITLSRDLDLPRLRIGYKDFCQWQNSRKQKEEIKQQEAYWLGEFAGEIPKLNLPLDNRRPPVQGYEGNIMLVELGSAEIVSLKQLALREGVTLYMVLLSVINVWLSKLCGQEDIVLGSPIAGRRHVDLERIIGMFVNTLALRNYPTGEKTFKEFLQEVKKRTLLAFENQNYPFEDLVEKILVHRDVSRNPLFDVMYSLRSSETAGTGQITSALSLSAPAPGKTPVSIPAPDPEENKENKSIDRDVKISSKFDMTLTVLETARGLNLQVIYNPVLFNKETIQRFTGYLLTLLSAIIRQDDTRLSCLEIVSEQEKKQVLYDFNETRMDYPRDRIIHQLFEQQSRRTPDHIGLVAMSGASMSGPSKMEKYKEFCGLAERQEQFFQREPLLPGNKISLTYSELNENAGILALRLIEMGCFTGSIVAIIAAPFLEMVIGIIAILKAGACYLPIDPFIPGKRIDYLLTDSTARPVLIQAHLVHLLEKTAHDKEILIIDIEKQGQYTYTPISKTNPDIQPNDPVYMIYTSGTTGSPRGVLVKHENLANYVYWFSTASGLTIKDRTVLTSSFAFDLGYTSLFPSILNGMQLHLLPKEIYMSTGNLLAYIGIYQISYLKMTPSLFSAVVEDPDFSGDTCGSLRLVVLGGEAINPLDVEKAYHRCPHLEIMNHYGPTEVTIGCVSQFIGRKDLERFKKAPSIGKPIFNTKAYILDRYLNVLPVGICGELYLSGAGVAEGYFRQYRLTQEKFITIEGINTDKIYRSGDLARWRPDGTIEFMGRTDNQVKIRGYRIELGEIESRLKKHKEIKEATVLVLDNADKNKLLCAYIVPQENCSPDIFTLKEYLLTILPGYMVPDQFVRLETLPLTPNGKLDRRRLPLPEIMVSPNSSAPGNFIEEKLLEIWMDLLRLRNTPGINTSFFELGGNSLKATLMTTRVYKEFKVRLPLVEVFKTPFIRGMASYIKRQGMRIFPAADKNLILLNSSSSRNRHLFLVHDGSGEVEGYVEFCQYLHSPSDFDWWGLRADIIRNNHYGPREITIQELSKHYIENIKKVQPQGPYYVAGWSLGGTIAFEMALQLEEIGEKISLLGLIDSPGPRENEKKEDNQFTLESESDWIWKYLTDEEIKEKVKKAVNINQIWSIILKYLEKNHIGVEIIKPLIPHHLAQVIPNYDQLGIKELIYYLNINRTLIRARALYIPSKKINTILHYFKASQSPRIFQDSWNDYCMKPIKSYEIPGNHSSIFKEPNVIRTAAIIEKVAALNFNVFHTIKVKLTESPIVIPRNNGKEKNGGGTCKRSNLWMF